MSNEKIIFLKDNEYLKNQNKKNFLLVKNLIWKSDYIDKSLNFFIENFPKEERIGDNSNKIINLFCKYNTLFYGKICLIKEKLNKWKQANNLKENFLIDLNKEEHNNKLTYHTHIKYDSLDTNNINIEKIENFEFSKIKVRSRYEIQKRFCYE